MLNRIPIRFKHWYITVLPLSLLYSFWLCLYGTVLDIDNPNSATDDNAVYDKIDWEDDLTDTLIIIAILVFGIGPAVQIILFWVSLYHVPCLCMKDRRHYMDSEERLEKRRQDIDSVAQASMW